ncbi:MAG: glycosyltransferase family 2 protein [Candidatus Margulisiibacteriota bacterium]|jgi:dolichol-phosphate mannosyltransferase
MSDNPRLSIIVPVYNEEGNLEELYRRIKSSLTHSHEIIFIDDGSNDNSFKTLSSLHEKDPVVKVIRFSRNFGHMFALSAGLDFAAGEAAITLDADLQHPPEIIPKLIQKWEDGYDIVNTIRKETKDADLIKEQGANLFYWLANKMTKNKLSPGSADFRLLNRKAVDSLNQFHERARFLRGLISYVGFNQAFIEYKAEARTAGKSKYSFHKMLSFALDGITSFSTFPLRLATYLGLATAFLAFVYLIYAIFVRMFTNQAIEGWASVLTAVLFIGGIQLIFLGIIGEYLGRVYEETKGRPLYIINDKLGF